MNLFILINNNLIYWCKPCVWSANIQTNSMLIIMIEHVLKMVGHCQHEIYSLNTNMSNCKDNDIKYKNKSY